MATASNRLIPGRRTRRKRAAVALLVAIGLAWPGLRHGWAQAPAATAAQPQQQQEGGGSFYIREYRVLGAHYLKPLEVEEAVYPYLGPGRTMADVQAACKALQDAYTAHNYTTVQVDIPPQKGAGGVVFLHVDELTVGRLRVHGSRYYDINHIKAGIPAFAEGKLVNFTQAQKELVGLNQLPDRRVTPSVQQGAAPGTMDIGLDVQDTLPLHGSVELNNRYSASTPRLRFDASLSYNNLWQLGHSIGGSVQISPENYHRVNIYTGFYTARFPAVDWLSLTVQGTKQNSDVATLGALDVVGKGDLVGIRAGFTLPNMTNYFHSFTLGIDYKDFDQIVQTSGSSATTVTRTPTTYVPITLDYSGTWVEKTSLTDLDLQVVFNIRGIGSNTRQFDENRFGADRNFIYFRGELSHTHDLPYGAQLFAKVSGQVSDSPLINSEQYSIGGFGTVRGYLESEVLADDAAVLNFEARTPSLLGWIPGLDKKKPSDELRLYFFTDFGYGTIQQALPEQQANFTLASFGGGARMTLFNHFNGSVDLAVPLDNQTSTHAHNPFILFRVWSDF